MTPKHTDNARRNSKASSQPNADAARNACPTCAAPVDPAAKPFPFCSNRCRLADLNKWFSEDYKLSRPIEQSDIEEGD